MLYRTRALVHLDHIAHNLRGVRARVGPTPRILLAVKADAYGHGAVAVAAMAEREGLADAFGVATVPEGIELREAGIRTPILKLSPCHPGTAPEGLSEGFALEPAPGQGETDEVDAAVAHELTVTVCDADGAARLEEAAVRQGATARAHLKVDTGMRRVGCEPADAARIARTILDRCPHVALEGVFTHLPVSDTPDGESFTRGQLTRFAQVRAEVEAAVGARLVAHAANSGGILGHPDSWLDLVRPGIMAYGSLPDLQTTPTVDLRPGLSWVSAVSFVKKVPPGETVGYGRTWAVPAGEPRWIATVPVGYGDGYDRLLSNRFAVLVDGRRLPIVGRVCMDQLMVDCGSDPVALGATVVLIGRSGAETITAWDVAARLGTIPYEITCRIAARVPRLAEGSAEGSAERPGSGSAP